MRLIKKTRNFGKRAFISDALVDIWAIIIFVIVIIVFFVIYRWSAEAAMQQIQDKQDVIYGNYLAQVYLRTPLSVAGRDMTMAELIALYDYNQTLERMQADEASFAEWAEDVITDNPLVNFIGLGNPMRTAIIDLTEEFVEQNFDSDRCFFFSIHGNSFDYTQRNLVCSASIGFSPHYLFSQLRDVPKEAYATYIAPVDPRDGPIILYSIYDFERLLSVYSPDPYFDMDDAARWATSLSCRDPVAAVANPACRERHGAAVEEFARSLGGSG